VVVSQPYAFASVKARVFRNHEFKISGFQEPNTGFQEPKLGFNGFSGTKHGFSGTKLGFLGTKKRVIRNLKCRVFKNQPFGFSGTHRPQNP
jgi:hypothetical protein